MFLLCGCSFAKKDKEEKVREDIKKVRNKVDVVIDYHLHVIQPITHVGRH